MKAKWKDLDYNRKTLRIPPENNKSKRVFYVALSDQALDVFSQIPPLDNNPYIFPSLVKHGKNLQDFPRRRWDAVRKASGLTDLKIHTLRHTFASWLASSGTSMIMIAKTLDQTTLSVTATYAHLSEDPIRKAVGELGDNIIPLPVKKKIG